MYEIYSLYMINEEEKTATFIDIQNHTDELLKSIGETYLNEGYDRYVIIGVLKNNRYELDGYEIFHRWEELIMYIIEYDNCEAFEDNRTWHSNKVFETKMQAIRFLIDEGFDVPEDINNDGLSFYKYFDFGLMHEAEIVEIEYVEDKASYLESPKPGKRNDKNVMKIAEESSNRYNELYKGLAEIERKE